MSKVYIKGTVIMVTTRTEVGLPFVSTEAMNMILWGVIARAQLIFPVRVVSLLFMANHLHMILIVDNPEDISGFMDRVKTESAHDINRLLGRRQRTVWVKGFDDPRILTPHDVVEKIAYIYANPQKASLVDTIEEYPGVSTWGMLMSGVNTKECLWVNRPKVSLLEENLSQLDAFIAEHKLVSHTFTLSPMDWTECFSGLDKEKEKQKIIRRVRELEAEYRDARPHPVKGAEELKRESMRMDYVPKTYGKKMICICSDLELRKAYINLVKTLRQKARAVLKDWRESRREVPFPPGLFAPSSPRYANMVPAAVF